MKTSYSIRNTQISNNSCEYKFLSSDGLSLLMNKLSFNSNKYLLDALPGNLKFSCTTLWSRPSMRSLAVFDKVPLTGLPVLGKTPDLYSLFIMMFIYIKESLFIKRDKSSLNRNLHSQEF